MGAHKLTSVVSTQLYTKSLYKMKSTLVCFLAVLTVGCLAVENDDEKVTVEPLPIECFNCNCPRALELLCGTDGRTYQNKCMMKCAKTNCPKETAKLNIEKSLKNRSACEN